MGWHPNFLSGDKSFSIPSVKDIGDVVNVKRDVPITKNISLRAIKTACLIPSLAIFKGPILNITSPLVINILMRKVMIIMSKRGFKPFKTYMNGTFDNLIVNIKRSK